MVTTTKAHFPLLANNSLTPPNEFTAVIKALSAQPAHALFSLQDWLVHLAKMDLQVSQEEQEPRERLETPVVPENLAQMDEVGRMAKMETQVLLVYE